MRVLVSLTACAYVIGLSHPAYACECAPPSAAEARARASFILEARVDKDVERPQSGGLRRVSFADVKVHRGSDGGSVTLDNGNDCPPFGFEVGKSYLLYLSSAPGAPGAAVTICNRVVESDQAKTEIAELGGASRSEPDRRADTGAPVPSPRPPPKTGGCAGCAMSRKPASTAGSLLAAILLASLFRRRSGVVVQTGRRSRHQAM